MQPNYMITCTEALKHAGEYQTSLTDQYSVQKKFFIHYINKIHVNNQ